MHLHLARDFYHKKAKQILLLAFANAIFISWADINTKFGTRAAINKNNNGYHL